MAGVASRLEIGSVFRGYRIDAVLGHGGMGAVYLATHLRLERRVAIKVLLPELATDESFRERFIRESQLAASLEHPNIVPVYDADEEEGVLYIVMRFIEGEDLGSMLRRNGPPDRSLAVSMIGQAGSALDAAHASGLVHRDVKPANIMIAGDGTHVYLTDFGVAKRLAAPGLTRTGFFVGTVDYCSPEQIEGKTVDARSDIYALAGVLFHCLAGRPPYEKDSDVAVITAHLLEPPPAITSVCADLPPAVDAVIVKAMAKRPEDRYQTAGEMTAAARDAITEPRPTAAAPPTEPARTVAAVETVEAAAQAAVTLAPSETVAAPETALPTAPSPVVGDDEALPAAARAGRRLPASRRTLLVAGVLLVAAVAAVVAVIATRGGSTGKQVTSPPPPPPPAGTVENPVVPTTARPWLASASGSVYATSPNGAVSQLDPGKLRQVSAIPDPAHPRAMVATGSRIVSADDRTVTIYRTPNFTPVGAVDFGSKPILAAGAANAPIAIARATGPAGGRICVVNATASDPSKTLDPCVTTVGFAPAGLGVASGGRVFVADRDGGKVQLLTNKGGQLLAGEEHDAGRQPSGRLLAFRDSLLVPVARGVAVLDLASGSRRRTIALPARPSDIWVASTGRLFAALPALGDVAVVDLTGPSPKPRLVRVGKGVAALGGSKLASGDESVYAATLGGRMARLDPLTGRVITSRTIPALSGTPPKALEVSDVTFTPSGRKVTAVIHLTGGTLPRQNLVTRDDRIDLGSAALALWEGGIVTKVGPKQGSGLRISFEPQPGRLLVNAQAKRGAFTHLAVRLGPDRRSVVLAFTKAPPKQVAPPPRLRRLRSGGLRLRRPRHRRRHRSPPPPPAPHAHDWVNCAPGSDDALRVHQAREGAAWEGNHLAGQPAGGCAPRQPGGMRLLHFVGLGSTSCCAGR